MTHTSRSAFVCLLGAFALASACVGTASAQSLQRSEERPRPQVIVQMEPVETQTVHAEGVVPADAYEAVFAGGCPPVISSHTDASFEGGAYVIQAGFAEQEIAAASYTLDPDQFPISVDALEFIIAQDRTIVPTVTKWTVFIWEGTPQDGVIVGVFSSDGTTLPHVEMPPGTEATNLRLETDPGIIVFDDGSATFSIGLRIDEHNDQTQNPCFVAPPSNRNAFPTTDTSGLQRSTQNWLFGVNCGPLGCPANGGWTTFAGLNVLCRPSGDWVMRATYSPANCDDERGACCDPVDGSCFDNLTPAECAAVNGEFQGAGTRCDSVGCPQPTGACCFESTGGCLDIDETLCMQAGGIWQGPGTACGQIVCFPIGACCLPDGTCVDGISPQDCEALDGVFQGDGTDCDDVDCPQPTGACCLPGDLCVQFSEDQCAIAGGTWGGAGSDCEDGCNECSADWDLNGIVNSADVGAFLSDYFLDLLNGTLVSDFDENGEVNAADVGAFLSAYFPQLEICS